MESLTLDDGQPYARHSDYYRLKNRRHRSSRLPTPEDSQSSSEGLDGRSPPETEPSGRDSLMRPVPVERYAAHGFAHHDRRDSRNTGAPHSPPYRSPESQKPSLPPLKTVLGASISSPPRTPSPHEMSMQLCAREPSYAASTYKPPSLYPNKKQRTEPFSTSQYGRPEPVRPAFAPSAVLEPRTNSRPSLQFPTLPTTIGSLEGRRHSTIASPPWGSHDPSRPSIRSANDYPASHYQTPEQTPTSAMLEPSFPRTSSYQSTGQDPFVREMRGSFGPVDDRAYSRRPSAGAYAAYPGRPHEHDNPRLSPYARDPRYAGPVREPYEHHTEYFRSSRADGPYAQAPYPGQGPAFFMPSHYEYQHGKARKRSNLPKQSTEIMKTWFDQNITNPYPSEEQKAVFSNATGISMTQVSNWFINHRRRCPELRDRRERGRGGSEA